jgi:hypothetical protein
MEWREGTRVSSRCEIDPRSDGTAQGNEHFTLLVALHMQQRLAAAPWRPPEYQADPQGSGAIRMIILSGHASAQVTLGTGPLTIVGCPPNVIVSPPTSVVGQRTVHAAAGPSAPVLELEAAEIVA